MAGHSKWANIKHRKQAVDDKRSKEFQKIVHEIVKAARTNPDPKTNSVLRTIITRARTLNMPQAAIDRALKKGEAPDQSKLASYFFGGIARQFNVLIQVETANKLGALTKLKKILQKSPIEIVPASAISHLFDRSFHFAFTIDSETELLNLLNDLDVTDLEFSGFSAKIKLSSPQMAKDLHDRCTNKNIAITSHSESFIPIAPRTTTNEAVRELAVWTEKVLKETEATKIYSDLQLNS